jgi:hypothetical protein
MRKSLSSGEIITTVPDLLVTLQRRGRWRDVFEYLGKYFVSDDGLEVKADVVRDAREKGQIVESHPGSGWKSWTLPEPASAD